MAKYFEVTVTVQHEVDGGKGGTKIKKVRESYLEGRSIYVIRRIIN